MVDQSRLLRLAAMLAIGAWMLLAHPYEGLRHDGVLYLGQALLHSRVPALSQDTFFAGGSQDSYSIYAHLMVPLYEHLGMLPTHVGVLLLGWVAMVAAVLALLRCFEPKGSLPLWGALAFAVMSPIYGGTNVIGYSEPFVTGRTFAEPVLLWSFVALLDGRRRIAAALLVLAALLHPLMTLPVMAASWCYLAQANRRWIWLLLVVPVAMLAALAGVPPWDGLLKTYDPYWWALVENANRMVMLSEWTISELLRVLLDVAILLAVARLRPADAWTRLLHAVAVTMVAAMIITGVATDALHAMLLTQLQLWRAHWIAHLLAMALAPWLALRLYRLGGLWQASACALALALLNSHTGQDHGVATVALWALVSLAAWGVPEVSSVIVRLACGSILLCILGLLAVHLGDYVGELSWIYPQNVWNDGFAKVAASPPVALGGFAALMYMAGKGRAGTLAALGLSALLLLASVRTWDQRPDLARAVESPAHTSHPFAAHLPADAKVYWPNQIVPVWSLLERASHYASQQGAGLLFNRNTALLFGPHKAMYRLIKQDRESCRTGALLSRSRAARFACEMPAADQLTAVCSQQDRPDYLVLPGRLAAEPLATWQPPTHRDLPQTYALYACSQLKPAEAF